MSAATVPRRLRADAERNRQRILAAAAEVFAAGGLDASLNDVARAAGVGIGTLYRRFADKAELVDALFEQRIDALVEVAEQAASLEDSWAGLVSFLDRATGMQVDNRALTDLLFGSGPAGARIEVARARLQPIVARLLAAAQRDGHVRRDVQVSDLAIVQLMLSAVGAFTHDVSPQLWRRHLVLLLDGLRARGEASVLPVAALSDDEVFRTLDPAAHRPPWRTQPAGCLEQAAGFPPMRGARR